MKTLLAFIALFGSVALAAEVGEVKVLPLDNFGGDTGSVLTRCQTKVGSEYDLSMITRDINTLKSSEEFEDIVVASEELSDGKIGVTFKVRRKVRFIAPLLVEGNDYFSDSRIAKEAELKDGYLYGEAELAEKTAKVALAYRKKHFLDVAVFPRIEIVSGNDAKIIFVVEEGERQKYNDFVFRGAEHAVDVNFFLKNSIFYSLDDNEFDISELHEAIEDLPWWNPMGWFNDDLVTADQLAQCCDKLVEVYRCHGYLDAKVSGPELVKVDDEEVDVVFTVNEGVQYRIGSTLVRGVKSYSADIVSAKSNLPAIGTIAKQSELDAAAERIKVVVGSGDLGLADTRVDIKYIPSEIDNSTVNLVFQVIEGVPVVINDVKIQGNDYTKDEVIRREIALGPGDRMLEDRAKRSQKRLENLDYFARVRYYLEPTDLGKNDKGAEYRNLVYEVEEKNTGSFMVGVGASSVDSVYVQAEVNQNNFDLFAPSKLFRGAGQKGRAYVAWGPRYQSAELGFIEPYLFNRQLELSVDIYRRLRWYDEYDLIRTGAMASISYPVKFWPTWGAFGRIGIGVSAEYIEFDEVDSATYYDRNGRQVSFRDEERKYGDAFEPVIHLFWTRDTRNNFRIPSSGYRTRLFVDIDPGGDNQYWRLGFNHRHYFNVWERFNHVFMMGLRAETIASFDSDDEVPIYNRMFLGGPRSIRGIEYRNVSPMVERGRQGSGDYSPWGGQTLFCMNFEYTIPIFSLLRLSVFSDLGSVGEDEFDLDFSHTFAWTVGVGVRFDLPMFPIRLDFATPIEKPDNAEKEVFSFTVGYDF